MNPALCPVHHLTAVATCARCGAFVCEDCAELHGELALCPDCLPRVRREDTPSWTLRLSLLLQGLALMAGVMLVLHPLDARLFWDQRVVVLPVLGRLPVVQLAASALGWMMVSRERKAPAVLGHSPSRVRTLARLVRWLALVNLALALVQLVRVSWFVLGLFGR